MSRTYLVTDADLYELSGYRGNALVGECARSNDGTWECQRIDRRQWDTEAVPTLAAAVTFLRNTCRADTIHGAASVSLPDGPAASPVVVAFRPTGATPPTVALRRTLKYAARQGLRCTGGSVPCETAGGVR